MAQWRFVDWLLFWILETKLFEFEWDKGNLSKSLTKHGIDPREAESVFSLSASVPLGIQVSPESVEERLGVIGPSHSGRLLQVAFTLREGKVRIISARRAHKKEKLRYEEVLRKITQRI